MMAVADLNDSGDPDIIWQALSGDREGDLAVWLMDGQETDDFGTLYNHPGDAFVDPLWEIGAIFDLLGDGQPEVIWQQRSGGARDELAYWQLDVAGDEFTRSASGRLERPDGTNASIKSEWRLRTSVDLLDTNIDELLFQGTTGDLDGRISYWEMDEHRMIDAGGLEPATLADSLWRMVGGSD